MLIEGATVLAHMGQSKAQLLARGERPMFWHWRRCFIERGRHLCFGMED
ncbi:hypothetical protein ACO2RV_24465 [Ancylobacter sp. VNQ12]